MAVDELRARYLRDRVMTATPVQRVVMVYDRLGLDLTLAEGTSDLAELGGHLSHALEILAELRASLDVSAGGPAPNLADIYSFATRELLAARGGQPERIAPVRAIVAQLREAWAQAAEQISTVAAQPAAGGTSAGAWVG
jgi:flagellar protein FliS